MFIPFTYTRLILLLLLLSLATVKATKEQEEESILFGDVGIRPEQLFAMFGEERALRILGEHGKKYSFEARERASVIKAAFIPWHDYRNKFTVNGNTIWCFEIPYTFEASYPLDVRYKIIYGLALLEQQIKWIRFVPRASDRHFNWIEIRDGTKVTGCGLSQTIGRINGKGSQYVMFNLAQNCDAVGIVHHEFMHALGFFHEQARADRDDYVKILDDNIDDSISGSTYQFEKLNRDEFPVYNYASVMHYGTNFFGKQDQFGNAKQTIMSFGNRLNNFQASPTDIHRLTMLYAPREDPVKTGDNLGVIVEKWFKSFGWVPSPSDHTFWQNNIALSGFGTARNQFVDAAIRRMFAEGGRPNVGKDEILHWVTHYAQNTHNQWMRNFIQNHYAPPPLYPASVLVSALFQSFGLPLSTTDAKRWEDVYTNQGVQPWRRQIVREATRLLWEYRGYNGFSSQYSALWTEWADAYFWLGDQEFFRQFYAAYPFKQTPSPTKATTTQPGFVITELDSAISANKKVDMSNTCIQGNPSCDFPKQLEQVTKVRIFAFTAPQYGLYRFSTFDPERVLANPCADTVLLVTKDFKKWQSNDDASSRNPKSAVWVLLRAGQRAFALVGSYKDGCLARSQILMSVAKVNPKYIPIVKKLAWKDAEEYCKTHYETHLATISTSVDLDEIYKVWGGFPRYSTMWIGLNDRERQRTSPGDGVNWRWSSGTPFTFSKWSKNNPDRPIGVEDCVWFQTKQKAQKAYANANCASKAFFACDAP